MAEQVCPVCRCIITEDGYELEGIMYCCEPCATGGQCVCGCCDVVDEGEHQQ